MSGVIKRGEFVHNLAECTKLQDILIEKTKVFLASGGIKKRTEQEISKLRERHIYVYPATTQTYKIGLVFVLMLINKFEYNIDCLSRETVTGINECLDFFLRVEKRAKQKGKNFEDYLDHEDVQRFSWQYLSSIGLLLEREFQKNPHLAIRHFKLAEALRFEGREDLLAIAERAENKNDGF